MIIRTHHDGQSILEVILQIADLTSEPESWPLQDVNLNGQHAFVRKNMFFIEQLPGVNALYTTDELKGCARF